MIHSILSVNWWVIVKEISDKPGRLFFFFCLTTEFGTIGNEDKIWNQDLRRWSVCRRAFKNVNLVALYVEAQTCEG